jgi:hypothetical protein
MTGSCSTFAPDTQIIRDSRRRQVHVRDRKEVVVMDQPKTLTVPDAGRIYFDLGRNASYEAARRGDIPVIRIGRLLRVPVVALERKLEEASQQR